MMRIIRLLLFPFAILYGIATGFRNLLYNLGYLKSYSFPIPIIKVGNLNTGGTGKTPMTLFLATKMQESMKVGILSRGYGRKTKGFIKANANSSAHEIGDEPLQLFRTLADVEIAVCEDRKLGIEKMTRASNIDLIVLDDAFQQRRIKGSMEILLTTYADPYNSDFMLPTGNLREFANGRKRADVIIVTKCPSKIEISEMKSIKEQLKPYPNQSVLFSTLKYGTLRHYGHDTDHSESKDSVILVTGIANASGLKSHLAARYVIERHFDYRDHHSFDIQNLNHIHTAFSKSNRISLIITTEKDWVKIEPLLSEENKKYWAVQSIEVEFLHDGDKILKRIMNNKISSRESIA